MKHPTVYRPPYFNKLTRFTSDINDLLKSIPNLETSVIGRDTNINLLSPNNSERPMVAVTLGSSFDQHITALKRVTENTATLIDHIWSKSIDRLVSGAFDASISDHHNTFAFNQFRILNKTINYKFKDHSDQCIDELETILIDNILLSDHFNARREECGNCDKKFPLFFIEIYKSVCQMLPN